MGVQRVPTTMPKMIAFFFSLVVLLLLSSLSTGGFIVPFFLFRCENVGHVFFPFAEHGRWEQRERE